MLARADADRKDDLMNEFVPVPDLLVTHSGSFHADELFSTVVLRRLYPGARLLRSRDPAEITPASDRIIYDVGRDYRPEAAIFDHHQRPAPLRPDGRPYSSFGLIWRHFGAAYLAALGVPEADIAAVQEAVDASFVLPIDLMDNGALSPSASGPLLSELMLPVLLESLRPPFDADGPVAEDACFVTAMEVARMLLEAQVARGAEKRRAETAVRAAIAATGAGRVLELPRGMPYHGVLTRSGADHILFVINPREKDWSLRGISLVEDGFELRADLPAAWAGLIDADLEAACGVAGAKFCHNGRFIAVAASREAIYRMAELAVAEAEARGL